MAHKRKRQFSFALLALLALVPATILLLFRIPVSRAKTMQIEVEYRMVDWGFDDMPRNNVENILGNKRVYLNGGEIKWLYLNSDGYKKVCPEQPFVMSSKQYKILATFKVRRLLLGGYSVADVSDTMHIAGAPVIHK